MGFQECIQRAISAGIRDSLNPYVASVLLFFFIVLSFGSRTRRRLANAGISFIASSAVTMFLIVAGTMDLWLGLPGTESLARIFLFGIAGVLIGYGFLIFRGWVLEKRNLREPMPILPVFPRMRGVDGQEQETRLRGTILLSVLVGVWGAFIGSAWPQDYHLYVMYYFWVSGGQLGLSALFFAVYSAAFVLPSVVVFGAVAGAGCLKRTNVIFKNMIPYLRIGTSAVFFSLGMGLVYLLLTTAV